MNRDQYLDMVADVVHTQIEYLYDLEFNSNKVSTTPPPEIYRAENILRVVNRLNAKARKIENDWLIKNGRQR